MYIFLTPVLYYNTLLYGENCVLYIFLALIVNIKHFIHF